MAENVHLELYKKYRPRRWEDIIGQDKVVKSLQGAVVSKKLPTAYAFLGERGCGKTSAALVLAKAINCLKPIKGGNPCNQCEVCLNIDSGAQLGVNYISMANKGTAEDVREIAQQARLASSINKQVWILDEVHNLSKAAFDALLIPLEDPKMPSIFILCSTEVNKIPQTILSRVQARKFSLVAPEIMNTYLHKILDKEDLKLPEETISTAIRMGRGSVRDTLSALEQVNETGEEYTNYGGKLLEAFGDQDLGKLLSIVATAAAEDSIKGKELAEQLFGDLRDLLLVIAGADPSLYPSLPVAEPKVLAKKFLGVRGLTLALDEVGDSLTRMTLGADSRVYLEIALVKSLQKLKVLKARLEK